MEKTVDASKVDNVGKMWISFLRTDEECTAEEVVGRKGPVR